MNYKNSLVVIVLLLTNPLTMKAMDAAEAVQPAPLRSQTELARTSDKALLAVYPEWLIYLLNAKDEVIHKIINPKENPVKSAEFLPDGMSFIFTHTDGSQKKFVLKKIEKPVEETPIQVEYSEFETKVDMPYYVGRIVHGTTVLIRKLDDKKLCATLSGHKGAITSVALDSLRQRIVTTSKDKTAKVWSIDGTLLATLEGHTDGVKSASFDSTGEKIVTLSELGIVKVWSSNGSHHATIEHGNGFIITAKFSAKGDRVLTTSFLGQVCLWKVDGSLIMQLGSNQDFLALAECNAEGDIILSSSFSNRIKVWKADGSLVIEIPVNAEVKALNFDAKGNIIAVVPLSMHEYNLQGKLISTTQTGIHDVESVNFSHGSVTVNAESGLSCMMLAY